MKLLVQITTSTAILVALTACGSSSSSTSSTTRQFADTAGTANEALDDGATLTAQAGGSSAVNLNYTTGETSLADASFALKKNADGELTFTVNGVEQAFTIVDRSAFGDGQVFGYEIADGENDKFVALFSFFGTLDEALDPNNQRYAQIWGYNSNQITEGRGELNVRGTAVVGTETRPDALASLPSATYSGRTRLTTYPTTGFVDYEISRTDLRSDMNMAADFGAGTVSGEMTNFEIQYPGEEPTDLAGSASMDQAAISGNSFTGTLTPDETLLTAAELSNASGTYGGTFYGPEGQQVGGTLSMSGTVNEDEDFVGFGFFEGFRD